METLTWQALESHLVERGPWALLVGGSKGVQIGYDPTFDALYLRIPAEEQDTPPKASFTELTVAIRHDGQTRALHVSTSSRELFREFHYFATLVAGEFEQPRQSAVGAFETAMAKWRALSARRTTLTAEQQLGLHGELLVLKGLLQVDGDSGVDAWVGRSEVTESRHDFRIGNVDLEVKTTRSANRRHVIHGLRQLEPVDGHLLYILSLRLEPAGANAGRSLPETIEDVRSAMSGVRARQQFDTKLASTGYAGSDSAFYDEKMTLADRPLLVPVDDNCPALNSALVSTQLRSDIVSRIDAISYRINVEGMGFWQGTPEFSAVVRGLQLAII